MQTNIEIDDELMAEAQKTAGKKGPQTKRALVEAVLKISIQTDQQTGILKLRGKVQWDGDLEDMRTNRFPDWDVK